jgi:hypothetical protein
MPTSPAVSGATAKIVDGRARAFLNRVWRSLRSIGNSERKNISYSGAGVLSAIDELMTDTMVLWTLSPRTPPDKEAVPRCANGAQVIVTRRRQEALDVAVADIGNAAFSIRGDVTNLTHHDQVIAERTQ